MAAGGIVVVGEAVCYRVMLPERTSATLQKKIGATMIAGTLVGRWLRY